MKYAILQVADCGPLESLVVMLRAAGYQCRLPDEMLRSWLRQLGCDTVLDPAGLFNSMGYDMPIELPQAGPHEMDTCDLYVDVKMQRNGEHVIRRWPQLKNKLLWYRINGARGEVTQHGDEVNIQFPILTPNLFYRDDPATYSEFDCNAGPSGPNWGGLAYTMWPPFLRASEYQPSNRNPVDPPICLIHGMTGWGYAPIIPGVQQLGVKLHGTGAPDGMIRHSEVPARLAKALCMVHLKSNDCPGYALYEAIYAGCPLIVPRRLIKRMRMEELFVEGETCLCFDIPGDARGCGELNEAECFYEIKAAMQYLEDPEANRGIAAKALERLKSLVWRPERDHDSFRQFMERHFGG